MKEPNFPMFLILFINLLLQCARHHDRVNMTDVLLLLPTCWSIYPVKFFNKTYYWNTSLYMYMYSYVIDNSNRRIYSLESIHIRRRWAGGAWYVAHISPHQTSSVTATHAAVNYTIWAFKPDLTHPCALQTMCPDSLL